MNSIILVDLSERIHAAIMENKTDLDSIASVLSGMSSGGMMAKTQVFEENGTWVRPHSGVSLVWALLVGAGGASFASTSTTYGGLAGGGGEVVFRPVLISGNITVVVGQGALGSNGGNSSIATGIQTIIAAGGTKGANTNQYSASKGLGGGVASTMADDAHWVNCRFGGGDSGLCATSPGNVHGGACLFFGAGGNSGTDSAYGSPGGGSLNAGTNYTFAANPDGVTPPGYGAGASGPYKNDGSSHLAARGAHGLVVLQWFE